MCARFRGWDAATSVLMHGASANTSIEFVTSRRTFMKRLVCIAAAAAFAFATSAGAQTANPAAPKPEAQKSANKPAAAHKSRRNEDARACLKRGSNTEIIKCAEA